MEREDIYLGGNMTHTSSNKTRLSQGPSHHHAMVHDGRAFNFYHLFSDVAAAAEVNILIRAGKKELAFVGCAGASAYTEIKLYEDAVVSAFGTGLTPRNMNRSKIAENDPALTNEGTWTRVSHTPTVTDPGTLIDYDVIFAATDKAERAVGAMTSDDQSWFLSTGKLYLLRAKNLSGDAANILLKGIYYELTD